MVAKDVEGQCKVGVRGNPQLHPVDGRLSPAECFVLANAWGPPGGNPLVTDWWHAPIKASSHATLGAALARLCARGLIMRKCNGALYLTAEGSKVSRTLSSGENNARASEPNA